MTMENWKCPKCGGKTWGRDGDKTLIHCHNWSDGTPMSLPRATGTVACGWIGEKMVEGEEPTHG